MDLCFLGEWYCRHSFLPDLAQLLRRAFRLNLPVLRPSFGFDKLSFGPGHALHEKGLQRQNRRLSTGRQPGTKRASRPADKPLINRWSTAEFDLLSVYVGVRMFVLLERR